MTLYIVVGSNVPPDMRQNVGKCDKKNQPNSADQENIIFSELCVQIFRDETFGPETPESGIYHMIFGS